MSFSMWQKLSDRMIAKVVLLADAVADRELGQRATAAAKVMRARSKLQRLRNRAEAPEGAIVRFNARREALRA